MPVNQPAAGGHPRSVRAAYAHTSGGHFCYEVARSAETAAPTFVYERRRNQLYKGTPTHNYIEAWGHAVA
jgi:hypothetical protein